MTLTKEAALGSRTARLKLPGRKKPYFRVLSDGVHLGYRRSTVAKRPGTWLCRRYLGAERYELHLLGTADDFPDRAPGGRVLTFEEAQAAATEWARARAAAERAEAAAETSPTIRKAVEEYISVRKARSGRAGRDAELRLSHHVLTSSLADSALATVTDVELISWREQLRRGGRSVRKHDSTLAPATLARLLNDLRAALSAAVRKARLHGDVQTAIREGLRAPEAPDRARAKQVLPEGDVRRLVEAAYRQNEDFGALVLVLAATGCRFDQAARLAVADLQPDTGRIMVPTSNKGRGRKAQSHIAVPLSGDTLARLWPLTTGRIGHDRLLLRWHHKQVEGEKAAGRLPEWIRTERRPWAVASEMTRLWRASLAAAGLSRDLVPYCLRHSSIIRGLRAGLPVRLVGAVHDTSVAMIEKHYGAFIVDATEDLLRRAVVPLAPATGAAGDAEIHGRRSRIWGAD